MPRAVGADGFVLTSHVDDADFNRNAEAALVDAAARLRRIVPETNDDPPRIVVYAKVEDWVADARTRPSAAVLLRIGRGAFADGDEAVIYYLGGYDTLALIRHEATHAWFAAHAASRPPVFVEEGVAEWVESGGRMSRVRRRHLAADVPPLATLMATEPADYLDDPAAAQRFYAAAWVYADGLFRHGRGLDAEVSEAEFRRWLARHVE